VADRTDDAALSGSDPVSVAKVLFQALERLSDRITRDLNVDAQDGVPPEDEYWAEVLARFVAFAGEVSSVLDEPEIVDLVA
jgi:hypothetical protein